MSVREKLTSRKFWIAVAAFLASLATGITGLATTNDTLAGIGIICAMCSAAIYAACEAYVDGQSVASDTTTTSVSASTTSKETVEKLLSEEENK